MLQRKFQRASTNTVRCIGGEIVSYFWKMSSPRFGYLNCCSLAQSCPTLCDPMDCRMPGFPVLHRLLKIAQTHVYWISDAIQPSHPLSSLSPPALKSFQASGSYPMNWLFASGVKGIGASASALFLPMNIQNLFPLGLTGLISLQSKGVSRVFSNTTFQKHQFFSDPSLWSNSHIHTWLLENL